MKVISIKKQKDKFKIKFDNDIEVIYHENVLIEFSLLKSNIEIDKLTFEETIKSNKYHLLVDNGIKYLSKIRSINQTKIHLLKHEEENHIVDNVINYLIDIKLLDDKNYASCFFDYKLRNNYGIKHIIEILKQEKIDNYIIDEIKKIKEKTELNSALKYLEKCIKIIKTPTKKLLREKCFKRLYSHGYSNLSIDNAFNELSSKFIDEEYDYNEFMIILNKSLNKYSSTDSYLKKQKITKFLISKGYNISYISEKLKEVEQDD